MWRIRCDTIQRISIHVCILWLMLSPHSVKSNTNQNNYNDQTAIETETSPLYEANADLNTYQLLEDNRGYSRLQPHPNSHSSGKVRYILRKKSNQGGGNSQIYALQPYSNSKVNGDPYANQQYTIQSTASPLAYYPTQAPVEPVQTSVPKKYAFAYAVRPGDGDNGDDFSHKETRDGKVTIGEYKVMLPDGRLQIVRYTADASNGFNADVTYEGESQPYVMKQTNSQNTSPTPKPYIPETSASPSPYSPYKHNTNYLQNSPNSNPNYAQNSPNSNPNYAQNSQNPYPNYSQNSPNSNPNYSQNSQNSYPNLSNLYNENGSHDHSNQGSNSRGYNSHPHALIPISPTPPVTYNLSPPSSSLKKSQQPRHTSYKKPRMQPQYHNPNATPNSIYDKIHSTSNIPYSPLPRGQRAGPSPTPQYFVTPTPQYFVTPTPQLYQEVSVEPTINSNPQRRNKILTVNSYDQNDYVHRNLNSKSRLVPIELFKAGPAKNSNPKRYKLVPADLHSHSSTEHDTLHPVHEHDTHYILHEDDYLDRHPDEHQGIEDYHNTHPIPESHLPPVKSSLATFTSSLGYKGTATPKPTLYIKSKPLVPVGRPIKPSIGGLVYLETPGQGPRPNSLGVKELLDRLPHDNLPRPKTTTHPYEIGRNDYGSNVGYTSNPADIRSSIKSKKEFIPSQEIPQEYLPRTNSISSTYKPPGSRDFLYDTNEEIVVYDNLSKQQH